MRRWHAQRDDGFTLIELLITMMLFGILVAIGVGPFRNYQRAQEHKGATRDVVEALRFAQTSSLAEAVRYRVDFTATGAVVKRAPVSGTEQTTQRMSVPSSQITLADIAFSGTPATTVWFYPRGTASGGSLKVVRSGSSKVYEVDVEGLTARVSYH